MATETYKVVVYGADLRECLPRKAAAELTSGAANGKVALIVPLSENHLPEQRAAGRRITCWAAL